MLPCLVGTALPFTAHAQETSDHPIEEVVVTAQYRQQGVQDVPIAIRKRVWAHWVWCKYAVDFLASGWRVEALEVPLL